MAKRIIVLGTVLVLAFGLALTGCSSNSKGSATSVSGAAASGSSSQAVAEKPADPTLGSTIEFDDLSIQFGNSIESGTFANQFSDHKGQTVIGVPVSVTNNSSDSKGLNMFYVKEFGSKGTQLDTIFTYYDNDVRMMGETRSGATMTGYLYFLYDGNGDYFITFDNFKDKIEVKVPVSI